MNNYIDIYETSLGLEISLKPEGKEQIIKMKESYSYDDIWKRLLSPIKGTNKVYYLIKPEFVGALTSAPIIAKGVSINSNGHMQFDSNYKLWWFPDYMIMDEFEEMFNTGHVYFTNPNQDE